MKLPRPPYRLSEREARLLRFAQQEAKNAPETIETNELADSSKLEFPEEGNPTEGAKKMRDAYVKKLDEGLGKESKDMAKAKQELEALQASLAKERGKTDVLGSVAGLATAGADFAATTELEAIQDEQLAAKQAAIERGDGTKAA